MKYTKIFLALMLAGGCGGLTQDGVTEYVAFTPDESTVVSLVKNAEVLDPSASRVVRSMDGPALREGTTVPLPVSRRYALSADGSRYAAALSDSIVIFATANGVRLAEILADDPGTSGSAQPPTSPVAIALDAAGATIAIVSWGAAADAPPPGHLRVFEVATQQLLFDVPHDPARDGSADWPGGVALSPDGTTLYGIERLLASSGASTLYLDAWRIADGARLWDVPVSSFGATYTATAQLGLSADGSLLAGGDGYGQDDAIYVWKAADGARQSRIPLPEGGGVLDIRFSPDGNRLVLAATNSAFLVGLDGTVEKSFAPDRAATGQGPWITSAAMSPDGSRIAGVTGPLLQIWNVLDGSVFATHYFKGEIQ